MIWSQRVRGPPSRLENSTKFIFYPITDFHIGPQGYVNCRVSTPLWVESTSNIQRDNTWWHLVVRGLAVHSCGLFYKASNGAPSGLIVSITLGPTDNEANKIAFWLRLRVHGAPWSISPPAGRSVSVPLLLVRSERCSPQLPRWSSSTLQDSSAALLGCFPSQNQSWWSK